MHQVFLEKICPLEAFQLHYCPDNDAKSMVKHLIFPRKFAVISLRKTTNISVKYTYSYVYAHADALTFVLVFGFLSAIKLMTWAGTTVCGALGT